MTSLNMYKVFKSGDSFIWYKLQLITKSKIEAERLKNKYKKEGRNARIIKGKTKGITDYRIFAEEARTNHKNKYNNRKAKRII